jgi:thiamine biosynthesis protein ThiC
MGSEWILGRLAAVLWIGFDWLRIGIGGELSGSCAMDLVCYDL